jgi:hypothetical protein
MMQGAVKDPEWMLMTVFVLCKHIPITRNSHDPSYTSEEELVGCGRRLHHPQQFDLQLPTRRDIFWNCWKAGSSQIWLRVTRGDH